MIVLFIANCSFAQVSFTEIINFDYDAIIWLIVVDEYVFYILHKYSYRHPKRN